MNRNHQKDRRYVDAFVQLQRSTAEVIVVAVVLAFGINLASSGLPAWINLSAPTSTALGALLIIAGFLHLAMKSKLALVRSLKLKAAFPVDNNGQPIAIDRYDFSEEMHSYIRAISAENKAIKSLWQRAKFGNFEESESALSARAALEGDKLVREAVEYFVLNKLSLHLSAYFLSDRNVADESVVKIQRRTIPQLLLDNRFLDLFSKPMSERAAFVSESDSEDHHNIVFATGEDGEIFDQFELLLPREASLCRIGENTLRIVTKRFTLQLTPVFERSSTIFPRGFSELYAGMGFLELHPYAVSLKLEVSFKWWSILTRKGWDYYEWLDSFIEELEQSFALETFIDNIGWHAAQTIVICARNDALMKRADALTPFGSNVE